MSRCWWGSGWVRWGARYSRGSRLFSVHPSVPQIRRRRPTPANLVLSSDQSSPGGSLRVSPCHPGLQPTQGSSGTPIHDAQGPPYMTLRSTAHWLQRDSSCTLPQQHPVPCVPHPGTVPVCHPARLSPCPPCSRAAFPGSGPGSPSAHPSLGEAAARDTVPGTLGTTARGHPCWHGELGTPAVTFKSFSVTGPTRHVAFGDRV